MEGIEFLGSASDRNDCIQALSDIAAAAKCLQLLLADGREHPDQPFARKRLDGGIQEPIANPVGNLASALKRVLRIERSANRNDPEFLQRIEDLNQAIQRHLDFERFQLFSDDTGGQ